MTKLFFLLFAIISGFMPLCAVAGDGYASSWQLGMQPSVSPVHDKIFDFHTLLLTIITVITLVVTALLGWVVVKYRRRQGVPAATFAHNTVVEIIWTIIPVIILIVIAIPSFKLLYLEGRVPEPEMTIKVTGYQWYWGYEYTDYDGLEFLSYPVAEDEIDESKGQRRLLSTDAPVVVPIDTNIQLLVTSADVIHAFALPAAGVKKDAVPGQLNETWTRITKPGTYFGQCSEICGTGHAYMPIEIKAVEKDEFDAWVASKGGVKRAGKEGDDQTPDVQGTTPAGQDS